MIISNTRSTPYNKDVYMARIQNNRQNISKLDEIVVLNDNLEQLISQKVEQQGLANKSVLTDADYRDILEDLHKNPSCHAILESLNLKSVSRYSFYSNSRATGKIEALQTMLPSLKVSISPDSEELIKKYFCQETKQYFNKIAQDKTQLELFIKRVYFNLLNAINEKVKEKVNEEYKNNSIKRYECLVEAKIRGNLISDTYIEITLEDGPIPGTYRYILDTTIKQGEQCFDISLKDDQKRELRHYNVKASNINEPLI